MTDFERIKNEILTEYPEAWAKNSGDAYNEFAMKLRDALCGYEVTPREYAALFKILDRLDDELAEEI